MSASQSAPPPPAALTSFPSAHLPAGQQMFRAHGRTRGAWWFDNVGSGRFTLRGSRGTCCTASRLSTAVREKVREHVAQSGVVDPAFASEFVVSTVTSPLHYRCAAVSHEDAEAHRVVRELVTMHDYVVPQAWAAAFDACGFTGIFYGSAYTTGDPSAYALFGDAGAPEPDAGFVETVAHSGAAACTLLGWSVGLPPAAALTVIS